eukprot:TRINITY_DN11929_c0_g2_i1.p2 TRINITY_DN11929_c0_g2~~TRINITY_DN11929_c0_g2_i1.p2  ORF type:complete len:102 (-),score=12.50 TRINITY_DN11929_c0_g2_i1:534-839(-)
MQHCKRAPTVKASICNLQNDEGYRHSNQNYASQSNKNNVLLSHIPALSSVMWSSESCSSLPSAVLSPQLRGTGTVTSLRKSSSSFSTVAEAAACNCRKTWS